MGTRGVVSTLLAFLCNNMFILAECQIVLKVMNRAPPSLLLAYSSLALTVSVKLVKVNSSKVEHVTPKSRGYVVYDVLLLSEESHSLQQVRKQYCAYSASTYMNTLVLFRACYFIDTRSRIVRQLQACCNISLTVRKY